MDSIPQIFGAYLEQVKSGYFTVSEMTTPRKIVFSYLIMTCALVMLYFMIYDHYWLVSLLGGYKIIDLIPVAVLLAGVIITGAVSNEHSLLVKRNIFLLVLLLFGYVLFASISVLLNESGFDNTKRYFIYVYTNVLIFISILMLDVYKTNENIGRTLTVLFITGVVLSLYIAIIFSDAEYMRNIPPLETNRGIFDGRPDGGYGVGKYQIDLRYTIPGMSPIEYGPLITPIALCSFYFVRRSGRRLSKIFYYSIILFLIYCIAMTASRSSFFAFTFGLAYLAWWRWFTPRQIIFFIIGGIAVLFTFAKVIFVRLIITLAIFFPFDLTFISETAHELTKDPRVIYLGEVMPYIYQNPLWGMGMTNFIKEVSYVKVHSVYIITPLAFGLPAGVFYLLFIFFLFVFTHSEIKKLNNNNHLKDTGVMLGSGLVAFMVYLNACAHDLPFIWVWFGLTAAWIRNSKNYTKIT